VKVDEGEVTKDSVLDVAGGEGPDLGRATGKDGNGPLRRLQGGGKGGGIAKRRRQRGQGGEVGDFLDEGKMG
jgi:hypothetical protein